MNLESPHFPPHSEEFPAVNATESKLGLHLHKLSNANSERSINSSNKR